MEQFTVFLFLLCACRGCLTIKIEVHDKELSVVLPCQLNILLEDILTVKWSRLDPNPKTVYLLQEGKDLDEQNQLFSGRTSMRPDALDSGDFSLTLRELQVSDSGNYICSIIDEREEIILSDVQLQVREKIPTWARILLVLLILLVLVSGGLLFHFRQHFMSVYRVEVDSGEESVLLPFKTAVRLSRNVTVEWTEETDRIVHRYEGESNSLLRTGKQLWRYEDRTEMKAKFKSGDLSLILKNPTNGDTGTYSCTVYRRNKVLTMKQVVLNVKGGESSGTCGSFIIAIDFGTAYSGYAFNITPTNEEIDPISRMWGREYGLETPKTPTCILFNEHEEFIKFGYEAKTAYINVRGEDAKKHYFFENFKMALYCRKLTREITIKAANGKEMTALKVFTEALRFLKDDALKTINSSAAGMKFDVSDFTWVLTVPAIWDESAKQFMREAAMQAGIVSEGTEDKLVIALEPEAASVWCKNLPAEGFITQNHSRDSLDQTPGTQYIVADCGGGTIDITVHEILKGGALKELHKASGNDLGGQNVDRKFKVFLREIFCDGVWDEYEENYPSEVQRMMHDFTRLKQVDDDVQVTCPFNLGTLAQKKKDIEEYFESVEGVSWYEGSIKISREKLRSFFEESLQGITRSLNEIFKKCFRIDFILLVGGYAGSQILRQHIADQFGEKCKILCPFRAQEAIVKGAVKFGKKQEVVASRKSAFTYGTNISENYDKLKHKPQKKYMADGDEMCFDVFMTLVSEGEDVGWDEIRTHTLNPVRTNQTAMTFTFFRTERRNVNYVDEWGVEEVASFEIDMLDVTGGINRKVLLQIKFGSTEITATATDVTSGSEKSIQIDFMTKS